MCVIAPGVPISCCGHLHYNGFELKHKGKDQQQEAEKARCYRSQSEVDLWYFSRACVHQHMHVGVQIVELQNSTQSNMLYRLRLPARPPRAFPVQCFQLIEAMFD